MCTPWVYHSHRYTTIEWIGLLSPSLMHNRQPRQSSAMNYLSAQFYLISKHLGSSSGKDMNFARTPLEMITAYNDLDLVMHPVIQKSIEVKWKLFGKMDTLKRLFLPRFIFPCFKPPA